MAAQIRESGRYPGGRLARPGRAGRSLASRSRARYPKVIFCQLEIGSGFPGGGLERLSLATGRSRAPEIVVGGKDFDAGTAGLAQEETKE